MLGVRISPAVVSLVNGENCQLNAFVYGFYNPSQLVTWSVSGNTSNNTSISEDGKLSIGSDENSEKITITATSVSDTAKSVSITVDIYQVQIVSTIGSVTVTLQREHKYCN